MEFITLYKNKPIETVYALLYDSKYVYSVDINQKMVSGADRWIVGTDTLIHDTFCLPDSIIEILGIINKNIEKYEVKEYIATTRPDEMHKWKFKTYKEHVRTKKLKKILER